jgi:transcriptional regulator with XRE-family HTH domain
MNKSNINVEIRRLRLEKGLSQTDFWKRVFVTQSGGSRYESGENIPKQIQALVTLAYADEAEAVALFNQLRHDEVATV